jgi:toxin ParE1/3/4
MPTKTVEVMDAAQAEVAEGTRWYRNIDAQLGRDFAEEYTRCIRFGARRAASLAGYLHGTKRHLLSRFPYQLVIRELPDRVQVVAVAHLRRKPGYWKKRLK